MIKRLAIGCGLLRYPDCIHLDNNPLVKPDVLWDLEQRPYPFDSEQFDEVLAIDVLEHLNNVVGCLEEIYRILKASGRLQIRTDNCQHANAFTDPTHRHFFTAHSFDYFDPRTEFGQKYWYYSSARFHIISSREEANELTFELVKMGELKETIV